jgi:hypothetical protein
MWGGMSARREVESVRREMGETVGQANLPRFGRWTPNRVFLSEDKRNKELVFYTASEVGRGATTTMTDDDGDDDPFVQTRTVESHLAN